MATEKQIAANRRNTLKSTGPKSDSGKSAVSQNALKHGLTAAKNIIKSESQADFDLHRAHLLDEFAPSTPTEMMLTDRAIDLAWRLKRASNLQNDAFDTLTTPKAPSAITQLTRSLLLQYSHSDEDTAPTTGQVVVKDFSNARVLERLLMYERRIENSLYKTILELQRLNMIKQLQVEKGV